MNNVYFKVYLKDGSVYDDPRCDYVDYSNNNVMKFLHTLDEATYGIPNRITLFMAPYENILKVIRVEEPINNV